MRILIEHNKGPQGWQQAKMAPVDSKTWGPFIRGWIQWMDSHGESVVTVGDMMLQIVTPKPKHTEH
jgi:hypothetical protein